MNYMVDLMFFGVHMRISIAMIIVVLIAVLVACSLPLLFIAARLRMRAREAAIKRKEYVVTQYAPPFSLTPAEMGYIYDLSFGDNEKWATLFDLMLRGKARIIDETHITLTSQDTSNLTATEKAAIDYATLPPDAAVQQEAATSLGGGFGFSRTLRPKALFRVTVYNSLVQKGVLKPHRFMLLFVRALAVAAILSIIIAALIVVASVANIQSLISSDAQASSLMVGIASGMLTWLGFMVFGGGAIICIVAGVAVMHLWTRIAGNGWLATKQYSGLWAEVEGYRQFLTAVDLPELEFALKSEASDSPLLQSLPYAMAFGIDIKWREYIRRQSVIQPDNTSSS